VRKHFWGLCFWELYFLGLDFCGLEFWGWISGVYWFYGYFYGLQFYLGVDPGNPLSTPMPTSRSTCSEIWADSQTRIHKYDNNNSLLCSLVCVYIGPTCTFNERLFTFADASRPTWVDPYTCLSMRLGETALIKSDDAVGDRQLLIGFNVMVGVVIYRGVFLRPKGVVAICDPLW